MTRRTEARVIPAADPGDSVDKTPSTTRRTEARALPAASPGDSLDEARP